MDVSQRPQTLYDLPKTVVDSLRCVYCNLYLSCGPIRCDANGDGICGRCIVDDEWCDSEHRNVLYEKAMATVRFPCVNDKFGCSKTLTFNQVVDHERNCLFRQVVCASLTTECDWKGSLKDLCGHLETHDLVLNGDNFELNTQQDVNDHNIVIKEKQASFLLQYKYVSAEKILFLTAVHFRADNSETECKVTLTTKSDEKESVSYVKTFICNPYNSKYVNVEGAQKIQLEKCLPLLEDTKVIVVKIDFSFKRERFENSVVRSTEESLNCILCSRCSIYMVPPIVSDKGGSDFCCKNCAGGSYVPAHLLDCYCKKLSYPCRWASCEFVGNYNDIRRHEFECDFAKFDCCLGCDLGGGHFNLLTFCDHLRNVHNANRFYDDDKITVSLGSSENTDNTYYRLFDKQLVVLSITCVDPGSKVEIKHYNFVQNKDSYEIQYYFTHTHCKMPTKLKTVTTKKCSNVGVITCDAESLKRPKCFKYTKGVSFVINSINRE